MDAVNQERLEENDTQQVRYLTFNLDDEVYGIMIDYVTEIIGVQQFTEIPETADFIRGVINLRGKIIPIIDVRLKFDKEPVEYNDRTCIIIVENDEIVVGLIVDQVADVLSFGEDDIAPPPRGKKGKKNRYISGIGKVDGEVKLLLDCDKLFSEKEAQKTAE